MPELQPNANLSHYRILRKLGAGGMGEVYLAEDEKLGRKVALKMLPENIASDKEYLRRFAQEARAASALNHPNILTIYEIGETDYAHYIAAEYIEGETLRQRLERKSLSLREVLEIGVQIVSALQAAHSVNIVHRDIKPENIMIRRDELVKILDFGIAKLLEVKDEPVDLEAATAIQAQTIAGMVIGTAAYMSPEQALGKDVDASTDLFSFGAVLYEMLAGKQAFAGSGAIDAIGRILHKEPVPLKELLPEIPSELERIIYKTLRKDREERYQTAKDLLVDLKKLQKRLEFESEFEAALPPDKPEEAETKILKATAVKETQTLPPNNLSEQFTTIIGREKEIAEIKNLLRQVNVRLVTMTGIGGTGKTTLSKAVARGLSSEFADGVFFIELAAIRDSKLVASTIARSFELKEAGDKPILENLKDYLRDKQILLVIDNFEQVIDAAPIVAELLAASSKLKILITSRTLLHLSFEREFVVPPLAAPLKASQISLEEISNYEAVKLFVERARSVKAGFALTEENARSIAEICFRLEGLPLAIELAAARAKILTPQAILAKMENRLKLLTGGARDLPARQQTMRGAIEWSYELLDEDEKLLFRRLAVFAGGFTLEAAESVCGGDELDGMLDLIASLVDKSLLIAKEQAGCEIRFRMLEVVREYALDALEASAEMEAMRRRHAEYFLALAEVAEPHLQGAESIKWLDHLEEEHDNLRAALEEVKRERDASAGLRFAEALWRFWLVRGHLSEGRGQLKEILEMAGSSPDQKTTAKVLTAAGTLAQNQGDYELAGSHFERSLAIWREIGDKEGIATVLNNLGWMAWRTSEYATARALSEEALALHRELGNKHGIAHSLNNLGWVTHHQGDFNAARAFHEESLAVRRELGDKRSIAFALNNLGWALHKLGEDHRALTILKEAVALFRKIGDKQLLAFSTCVFAEALKDQGDYQSATAFLKESMSERQEIGSKFGTAFALGTLGDATSLQGDYQAAAAALEQSLSLFREIGDKYGGAYALYILAKTLHDQGEDKRATTLLKESLNLRKAVGDKYGIVVCLELLAQMVLARQQPQHAAWLCGAAQKLREIIGARPSAREQAVQEHLLSSAREALGEEALMREFARGRAADWEGASDYALEIIES